MSGAYAPIKYLNGDVSDVVGALLDASVRGGFHLSNDVDVFINLRYVGGGAEGLSTRVTGADNVRLNGGEFHAGGQGPMGDGSQSPRVSAGQSVAGVPGKRVSTSNGAGGRISGSPGSLPPDAAAAALRGRLPRD